MTRSTTAKWMFACGLALWGLVQPAHAGTFKVLHSFNGSDGANPSGDLVDVGGTLYGTTVTGGGSHNRESSSCGIVFQYKP